MPGSSSPAALLIISSMSILSILYLTRRHTSTLRLVFITAPNKEVANQIASRVVGEGLAACVNVVGGVTSTYSWKGEIVVDEEVLMIVKTTWERLEELEKRIVEIHPYDTPEFVAVKPDGVNRKYLEWVEAAVARKR